MPRTTSTLDDARGACESVNGFALDLLRRVLGSGKGNVAISPWSIVTALSMARAGARGTTAHEMDRVLHVHGPATIDHAMNGLDQELRRRNGSFEESREVELSAANRLFVQHDVRLERTFVDTLADQYGADAGLVDFARAVEAARVEINQWVAVETRDHIKELVPRGAVDEDTRLVLVNAVYLQADWATPFKEESTRDGTFHGPTADVTARLMRGTAQRGWSSGDGWRSVDLEYAGGQLVMTVLVPDADRFDEIAGRLDDTLLAEATGTTPASVDLTLPKFDISTRTSLSHELTELGMRSAFTNADFSGMTDESLVIGEVLHQADVAVSEKETVATAATAVVVARAAYVRLDGQTLVVDRPFVFLLRDRPTGVVVFAGQVTDPTN